MQVMRFPAIKGIFMRRVRTTPKPSAPAKPANGTLDRATVQDAIDWTTRNRERRKRLGLE